jgi:glycosyltransferase involved in cell wall biosynthesis
MNLNSSTKEQYKVLATFLHGYQYGKALGGVERRFVELSKCFPELGIQLVALEYSPSVGRVLSSQYRSIIIGRQKPKTTVREAFQLVRLSALSAIWARRSKCDLVYSPSEVYSQVIPAFFASFVLRKPLVIVFHSLPAGSQRKSYASTLKSRFISGEPIKKALVRALIQTLRGVAYESADACIAVSKSTAEQIQKTFAPRSLIVSGNGVSDEWFSSELHPKLCDACFLGRISPRKGVDLLLHAWSIVVRERPDAKLVLVGGGENPKYVESCREMIRNLRLENNVTMTGFLDDEHARHTLSSAKLFVLPSIREGFGLAVAEAMARGVPCILAGLPSLRENFGDSALFVDGPDPEVWARSICRLLADERTRCQMSESGRTRAKSFRWDTVAGREAIVIQTLINSRRHRS